MSVGGSPVAGLAPSALQTQSVVGMLPAPWLCCHLRTSAGKAATREAAQWWKGARWSSATGRTPIPGCCRDGSSMMGRTGAGCVSQAQCVTLRHHTMPDCVANNNDVSGVKLLTLLALLGPLMRGFSSSVRPGSSFSPFFTMTWVCDSVTECTRV